MAPWLRKGLRLDIELAVALELACVQLQRAANEAERQHALAFNETLWTAIRRLVATAPEVDYRSSLLAAAGLPPAKDEASVIARNTAHASALAGKAATGGALKNLLNDWREQRQADPEAQFGTWLLSRMDTDLVPFSV